MMLMPAFTLVAGQHTRLLGSRPTGPYHWPLVRESQRKVRFRAARLKIGPSMLLQMRQSAETAGPVSVCSLHDPAAEHAERLCTAHEFVSNHVLCCAGGSARRQSGPCECFGPGCGQSGVAAPVLTPAYGIAAGTSSSASTYTCRSPCSVKLLRMVVRVQLLTCALPQIHPPNKWDGAARLVRQSSPLHCVFGCCAHVIFVAGDSSSEQSQQQHCLVHGN